MTIRHTVKLTASFECNLEEVEAFLLEVEAGHSFDALLDELTDTIIPNLERFPRMGRMFLDRSARSVEVANGVARLNRQLDAIGNAGELREYVTTHYLLLYALIENTVYLLSIRHYRQLSFDFQELWALER